MHTPARTCPSRFTRPVFLWAMAALVTDFSVQWLRSQRSSFTVPAWTTLLPLVPAMFFFAALVRTVQRMDEMQKRICLEASSIAFLLTLVLSFIVTGLEQAGIYHPAWHEVGSLMMVLWACAYLFISWRYQ
jgi:hypothetical protein